MWHKLYGVISSYKRLFGTKDGQVVLEELAIFTAFYTVTDTDVSNEMIHRLEGRREVFDHIIRYCNLPPEQVQDLHRMVLQEQDRVCSRDETDF